MIVAPKIRSIDRTANGVRLTLEMVHDLSYFEGHFPEHRLLPGVVQVTWAIELGRTHIPFDAQFRAMRAVKFMRVIQPGETVTLELAYRAENRELDFSYDLDGRACSSGTVQFA